MYVPSFGANQTPNTERKDFVKSTFSSRYIQCFPWNSDSLWEVRIEILTFLGTGFVVWPSHGICFHGKW